VNVFNAALVDHAGSDVAGGNQVAQPFSGVRIDFVVVGRHLSLPLPAGGLGSGEGGAGVINHRIAGHDAIF
jgi:hypothetical protein